MTTLAMGANAPLPEGKVALAIALPSGASIDVTALQLYADGKVRGDGDMCFFNQPEVGGGALALRDGPRFEIDLPRLGTDVEKIVVTATTEGGRAFDGLGTIAIDAQGGPRLEIDTAGRQEAALILAEVYRRNGQWKIRNVSQGFNGGLQKLAEHFGVEIDAPTPEPAPQPAPAPAPSAAPAAAPAAPVSLSKVSLTKNDRTVSLTKKDGRFGKIRVNLNWNQKKTGGLFGMGKKGIDLDLGAFVELKGNARGVIQALGNTFGSYEDPPFIRLMGDDRTGAVTDGEWIEINGDQWGAFERLLIFCFIYEGAADWQQTDAVVRVLVPDQPEIEVRLNEYGSSDGMCAIAMLRNDGGQIRVDREVRFFKGHKFMDEAYGWGMRWQAGSK